MSKMPTAKKVLALCTVLPMVLMPSFAFAGGPDAPSLLPPVAHPGECYARVKIPAQYATSPQGIVAEEGYTDLQIRQPQLRARQENVLTKEPSVEYKVRQPVYSTVHEQILVRPAYDKLSVSSPQFKLIGETIQISSPRLVWKKGNPGQLRARGYIIHSTADGRVQQRHSQNRHSGAQTSDQSAFYGAGLGGQPCGPGCEIWCLVEEPGETRMVSRRVMTSPGQVHRTPVPPKYQTIAKQIVTDPGGVEEIHIPAEYRTVIIEDVVDPGGVYERPVAPKYASVETKTLIAPERYEWRRVLCAPGTGSAGQSSHSGSSSGTRYYETEKYPAYRKSYIGSQTRKRDPRRH